MSTARRLTTSHPEQVLTAWLDAITKLQLNYNRLVASTTGRRKASHSERSNPPGQCPTQSLLALRSSMEMELAQLLQDMEQAEGEDVATGVANLSKLVKHTRRLNRLNQQAQTRFHLLTLSSC